MTTLTPPQLRSLVAAARTNQRLIAVSLADSQNPQDRTLAAEATAKADAFESVLAAIAGSTTLLRIDGGEL